MARPAGQALAHAWETVGSGEDAGVPSTRHLIDDDYGASAKATIGMRSGGDLHCRVGIRLPVVGLDVAADPLAEGDGHAFRLDRLVGRGGDLGDHVDAHFDRLTTAFRHALANGRGVGEIAEAADIDDLAAFFTMTLVGVATAAKGRADPLEIHAARRVATGVLDQHRPR